MKPDNIETLIVTVEMKNANELLERMNIQTEFVVGNQTDFSDDKEIFFRSIKGKILSRRERGVGRNRNVVMSAASATIF